MDPRGGSGIHFRAPHHRDREKDALMTYTLIQGLLAAALPPAARAPQAHGLHRIPPRG